jgi:heme-degrading monooxygenase HmoA
MDGFISVERFQSLTDPDKLLSLSFWRDDEAVARWRCHEGHRAAQTAGRKYIFRDYRLLVTFIVRDYGMSGVASRYYSSTVKPSMTRRSEARDHFGDRIGSR